MRLILAYIVQMGNTLNQLIYTYSNQSFVFEVCRVFGNSKDNFSEVYDIFICFAKVATKRMQHTITGICLHQFQKGHYNKDRKVVKIQNRRLHT